MSRPPRTLQGKPDWEAPARGVDAGHTRRAGEQCPGARADDARAAMHVGAMCEVDASAVRNLAAVGEPD